MITEGWIDVSVRLHSGGDLGVMGVEALISRLKQQIIDKK